MIYRQRKEKTRYGVTRGRCYTGLHLGLRSWYIPHDKKLSGLKINDRNGIEEVIK